MKHYYKSLLSFVMSVLIIFSVCTPALASYTLKETQYTIYNLVPDGEVSETGYQAQKIVDENGKEVLFKSASSTKKPVANKVTLIPSSYSSKDLGYCSEVRNQGGTNSCWAFASVASAEATLLRKGLINSTDDAENLSEAHLVWFAHKSLTTDVDDPTFGDGTNVGSPYSSGGDWHRSTFALARGSGFALEKDYPFYPYNSALMGDYDESKRYDSKVTLNEAYIIPEENTDEIKTAIMEYGSVSVAGLIVTENLNGSAYYQDKYVGTNHQMIIVGWDDNYSVDNFRADCKPSNPGAWFVKNSYDTTWGESGYFWISYEEPSLTTFFVQDVSIKNENETTYQYDGFGYHSMLSVPDYYDGAVANVFTAEKNEAIESVAFYTAQDNVTYEISVYKNVTKGADNPVEDGNKFSTVTEGFVKYQGYHKIELDKVVPVSKGETFSVVVRMSVPESNGNPIIIPVEGRDATSDGYFSRYYSSEPGQSFFTLSNLAWSSPELSDDAGNIINYNNVCVKAFTIPDNALEIRTAEEFNDFASRVANGETFDGRNVNLMADVDFDGGEIIPVGTKRNPFKGFFLGNGHILKNGTINSDSDYTGVFTVLAENAEISKLGVEGISVSGTYGVGAICGYNKGKIIYCYSTGNVSGEESVGGLVGVNAGTVSHSYSICSVVGEYDIGSFIGEDYNGNVINSYVLSSVLEPIGNGYSDEILLLNSKYFANGLVAFYLDEGKTTLRKKVWTKRDGKTTFLESDDEIIYQVELYDKTNLSSTYLYVNANDNIKELAEKEKEGMTVTIYADPKHNVLYNSIPKANMILYVVWTESHICSENLEFIKGVEATCYTDGNKPYYKCSCEKLYADENAENLVTENDVLILALWHPSESLIKTERVEPTHTEDGNIEYYTCSLCLDVFAEKSCINEIESVVIPALGHNHADWVVETNPGCETVGLKVKICSCGDRIEESIPATGHTPGAGKEENIKEADCENDGSYDVVVYCTVCGDELSRETKVVELTGHTYYDVVTPPTESEKGCITKVCSVCGDSYISEYIDALTNVNITVAITSYLSETDETTVDFLKYGETAASYTKTFYGNSVAFEIESIESGVYNILVSKKNHATRVYENVVIKAGEYDFEICPVGDANCDGKITINDYTMVLRHTKKTQLLDGYSFDCADADFSGNVNIMDYSMILKHVKKTEFLWK